MGPVREEPVRDPVIAPERELPCRSDSSQVRKLSMEAGRSVHRSPLLFCLLGARLPSLVVGLGRS